MLGDTANWRSIKKEENKAPMEPACEIENMIYCKCMYILHACIYFLCIQTHTHSIYAYVYILNVCIHRLIDTHVYVYT